MKTALHFERALLPGVGLWRVSPVLAADDSGDEGDDEGGDVVACVHC